MKRAVFFLVLFVGTALGNLTGLIFDYPTLAMGCKAALMPLLFLYAQTQEPTNKKLFMALFFSWLGDLFLIPDGELFFILGIGSFWGAQVCYIQLILRALNSRLKNELQVQKLKSSASVYLLYLILMLLLLMPLMGTLKLPVAVYATTLCLVGYLSVQYHLVMERKTGILLVWGVLLFILSDSMIAFDAFYFTAPVFKSWIMATYIPAQFLIVRHFTHHSIHSL